VKWGGGGGGGGGERTRTRGIFVYLLITAAITLSKYFNIYSTKCIPCGREEVFNYLFVLEVHSPKKLRLNARNACFVSSFAF